METYTLAEPPAPQPPPQQPVPPPNGTEPPPEPQNQVQKLLKQYGKFILIGGVVLGFLIMFLLGMMINGGSQGQSASEQVPSPTPSPTEVPQVTAPVVTPEQQGSVIQYLPGKQYFDDSLAIITKKEPFHTIFINVSRFEQETNYTQYAKVNYYNASSWFRENVTTAVPTSQIVPNPLISAWNIRTQLQANARDQSTAEVTIETRTVRITMNKISYPISTQSYPGYTKFIYFGEGTITTSEGTADVWVQYAQTYTSNALDLAFLSTPERLTSNWLVFWDEDGTAYHMDTLSSAQRGNSFQNYQTATIYYPNATSTKLNEVRTQRNAQNNQYTATFVTSPQVQLNYVISAPLNKSTDRSYTWQTGIITGNSVVNRNSKTGVGLMEAIQPSR